jgi:DNA-binding SARP family transcriptional activator
MLRYKVTSPLLPRCVDRPQLLRRVLPAPVLVLAAPAGHGKTCLADQVAAATGGPVAWFRADELDRDPAEVASQILAALAAAWTDLGDAVPASRDDDSAVALLGSAMETLAGPGCLVMDDVHLLPADVLDTVVRTAVAALPPDCRLVICTRSGVPAALLRAEAMSRIVSLGPGELAFDEDECGRVVGSPSRGAEIYARTGGWPLAVAMGAQVDRSMADQPTSPGSYASGLAELGLSDLPSPAADLLVVLARLPRFPVRMLQRLDDRCPALESFGKSHPALVALEDGWWALREWLRDVLRERGADQAKVDAVARALRDVDEDELAVQLLIAEARYEDAVPLLEKLASEAMLAGRAAWVRALTASVPSSVRTFTLDLLAASAAQALNLVDDAPGGSGSELALLDLVERSVAEGPGAQLRARGLLASHYRMEADARMLTVCEAALGDALRVEDPERELAGRWSQEDAPAAAEMLRLYGHAQLFARSREVVARGRSMVAAALDLLHAAGRPTTSLRGWSIYFEVLLFLRRPDQAVRPLRLAAHRLAGLDHSDAALRLAELATLEYFAAEHAAARRTIEMAHECADRTGNTVGLVPLAAIELALDVLGTGFVPEHASRYDDIAAGLAAHPRLAHFGALIAAEFGVVLAHQGQLQRARQYLELAEREVGDAFFAHTTSFRCRRLRGLLLLAEGRTADGRAVLEALRRDAVIEGRDALVDLVTDDLTARRRVLSATRRSPVRPPPVVVHVLARELSVTVHGEGVPAPRGYPAKLLALLVASNGLMTVDAAIEGLWPGADPDVGRNRLHGVLLRLRRGLGFSAEGPITCTAGAVRLERSPDVQVDSWEFEALAARADTEPGARPAAVALYRSEVLSVQFAYDDTVAAYRRALRQSFLDLATALLVDPPDGFDVDDLASLARRAWRTAPGDDGVCLAAVRALAWVGRRAEARELVDATARALLEDGVDGEAFRRRVLPVVER